MPTYEIILDIDPIEEIEAPSMISAAREAADIMGRVHQLPYFNLKGPNGKTWYVEHDGGDGRAGWHYTDYNGKSGSLFPKQSPRRGTLWADKWHGLYLMDDGRILYATDSDQFEHEDFALVGAVYYSIFDEGEEDGGWYGYYEETRFSDFADFVSSANGPRIVRKIADEDDAWDEIAMLEDGEPNSEVLASLGVSMSRRGRSKGAVSRSVRKGRRRRWRSAGRRYPNRPAPPRPSSVDG